MISLQDAKTYFGQERGRMLHEWEAFLRFPSVSADPGHASDCRDCAEWLVAHLGELGLQAEFIETQGGHPVVFAERIVGSDRPTVLLYGHYDVQPVDPLDQWQTAPFEPTMRNGRLYARGAEDNKGQLFYALKAVEFLVRRGELDLNLKVVVEGEEESGGEGLPTLLASNPSRFAADVLLVSDTGTVRSGQPTIIMGLRGILFLTVELDGADHDLHSGVHGGIAPNPAQGIARLIDSLHHADGAIAVDGYLEGVVPPNDEENRLAHAVEFDEEDYRRSIGTLPAGGETSFSPQVRVGFRPTIEVNGVHSGYGGSGSKTVIPASAMAKLSSRVVAGQDPERCLAQLKAHLEAHTPDGFTIRFPESGIGGPGLKFDPASSLVSTARDVLNELGLGETVFLWEGASIPVVPELVKASGAEPLLVGFGHDDDRIHAPNESFSITQFQSGFLYASLLLSRLGS